MVRENVKKMTYVRVKQVKERDDRIGIKDGLLLKSEYK